MFSERITINRKFDEEQSPVALLVQEANQYKSTIKLQYKENVINAKSIMGVMVLRLAPGVEMDITIDGEDEELAVQGMKSFLCGA